jgi:ABC-type multidrug transport system ATPase subunit
VKFSKISQVNIYKILVKEWRRIFSADAGDQAIELLNSIWDLRTMKSEDERYENAYEDIIQHYVRNQDWETDYLFIDRLKLYDDTTDFKKYIEVMLVPKYYESADQLEGISAFVDIELRKNKLRLVIEDYNDSGFPIQKVYPKADVDQLPAGVKKNNIPFYVLKDGLEPQSDMEYFTLIPNKSWNDYSVISIFNLNFETSAGGYHIGHVKIIHREEMVTWEVLPDKFFQLSDDFCSLSGEEDYYFSLQERFKNNVMISILFALQDAAYFTDILDRYEKNSNFRSSLIRSDDAERLLREIKPKLLGNDLSDLYSFSYRFKPVFSPEAIKVDFDFNNNEPLPSRIFAVIGKNGTGKTQLLNALPNSFSKNDKEDFYNKIPSFSKIIAVSYSVFDNFTVPQKNATFNYVYCGLKDEDGDLRSSKGLVISFHHNWKKIEELGRTRKWRSILANFIDKDIISGFIVPNENNSREFEVSLQGFHANKNKLSSGQSILLYIITQVVANIRLDSLILYDEPETHLHPNAIVELMNTIYELVDEFESYCLVATHSPLVIRELFSKNVYVMERNSNMLSARRIGIESFGENLSVLSDEVFGDRQIPKQYKAIIERLITQGKEFEEIVELLEFDEFPLSLNARIFIKSMIRNNNSNEEF